MYIFRLITIFYLSTLCLPTFATEIPADHDHHVAKIGSVDVVEDWLPRCASWFPVVAHSEPIVARSQSVRKAVVPSVAVLGADGLDECHRFVWATDR